MNVHICELNIKHFERKMLAHSLQPKRSRPPRELEKAKTNKQTNKNNYKLQG